MNGNQYIKELECKSVEEQFAFLESSFPGKIVFSTSFGQEDQVITDIIFENNLNIKVFTLDTGRLFEETYKVLEQTIKI